MSHLTLESLARLIDEAPTATEQAHLAACDACGRELAALRRQREALAALPAMVPPPDRWVELRERLLDEGLMAADPVPAAAERGRRRAVAGVRLGRIAAAVVLFAGGVSMGYLARGPVTVPVQGLAGADAGPAGQTVAESGADAVPTGAMLSSDVGQAQEMFLAALDRYMSENTARPVDPATRLAALDHIVHTTAEALNEAPADPVINSYHLTAVAQRNAMLRQMAGTRGEPVF